MRIETVIARSEAETEAAGRELGTRLQAGAVVHLLGDLGAGKTVFVRGLAQGLGVDPGEVSSPTFTLVQEYRGGRVPLFHVDLYRLEGGEVGDLGLDALAEEGVVAIEWANRLPELDGSATVVRIEEAPEGEDDGASGETRRIEIEMPRA